MRLLIIRHAPAVPRGTPGVPDDERPLTAKGDKQWRRAARGLARVARRPDVLLTSPLPRAARTAEIAARAWRKVRPTQTPALAEGSFDAIAGALAQYPSDCVVAVVGHEPDLSGFLARLLGSPHAGRLTFRKGGAALVDVPGEIGDGGALLWYLSPRILRRLGR
jgi:phosphohistidine phosphatase